jgi:hypothetical protein
VSDDPRTDFFASGADDTPAPTDPDPRTSFFATGDIPDAPKSAAPASPEPTYDAGEFKRRVGRDPEGTELANFKASKGEGFAGANGTPGGSLAGLGEAALATGAGALKGISHAANDILPDWGGSKATVENEIQTDPVLNYRGAPEAQPYLQGISDLTKPIATAAGKAHQFISDTVSPRAADVAGDVASLLPAARGLRPEGGFNTLMRDPEAAGAAAGSAPATAESVLADQAANSKTSMGAAAASPDISNVSPELKQAIVDVGQSGGQLHQDALARHIDAETLPLPEGSTPLRLRKGQATADVQQLSDEKNLRADPDTQGILSDSITDQDQKLGASMGEIRRRATPDIVQRSNAEHGQAAVDAIKTEDNAAVTDIRQKYKALADQNGGAMPIDTGAVINQITDALGNKFLTKTAAENPDISEIMANLSSGKPMTFEQFENARTNLAEVQRAKGTPAAAAGVVRNALENMPLTPAAQGLKDMANTARSAAKARFDTIEQNPAYESAINDNVPKDANGLHVIGAPSPIADRFMDQHFLGNGPNATRAYVQRIKNVMQNNPDFASSIEGASLNKLRDAAGLDAFDTGPFRNAGYRNARNAMDNKADVLMSPKSAELTDQLKRVSGYVNDEGKASSVNRSNTALTLQRFGAVYPSEPTIASQLADVGADVAAGHAGPVGVLGKRIAQGMMKKSRDAKEIQALKDAKLKFARDATAPGAGLRIAPKAGGGAVGARVTRATGGKVDHEALVERLIQRWKAAKKATDKTSEKLLSVPDATITKALKIAQEHI